MLMVPSAACRVIDDWYVMGLKGTGSNTVTVDDVFVPDDQSYAVSMSKKAVELLFQAEGSRGLFEGAAVQRAFCGLHAASVHLAVGWEAVSMNYGEIVLGGEPVDHMF